MKKLTKEEAIEKAISEAIVAHNDLCANDIECIPHHRVMPIVSKALSGVGEEEKEEIIFEDSEKGKYVKELINIVDGNYYNFQHEAECIIAKVKEYSQKF